MFAKIPFAHCGSYNRMYTALAVDEVRHFIGLDSLLRTLQVGFIASATFTDGLGSTKCIYKANAFTQALPMYAVVQEQVNDYTQNESIEPGTLTLRCEHKRNCDVKTDNL